MVMNTKTLMTRVKASSRFGGFTDENLLTLGPARSPMTEEPDTIELRNEDLHTSQPFQAYVVIYFLPNFSSKLAEGVSS